MRVDEVPLFVLADVLYQAAQRNWATPKHLNAGAYLRVPMGSFEIRYRASALPHRELCALSTIGVIETETLYLSRTCPHDTIFVKGCGCKEPCLFPTDSYDQGTCECSNRVCQFSDNYEGFCDLVEAVRLPTHADTEKPALRNFGTGRHSSQHIVRRRCEEQI